MTVSAVDEVEMKDADAFVQPESGEKDVDGDIKDVNESGELKSSKFEAVPVQLPDLTVSLSKTDGARMAYTDFITRRPCVVIWVAVGVVLAMSAIAFLAFSFNLNNTGNFYPREDQRAELMDAYRMLPMYKEEDSKASVIPQSRDEWRESFVYEAKNGDNLLTASALSSICRWEKKYTSIKDYDKVCWKPITIVVNPDNSTTEVAGTECAEPFSILNMAQFPMQDDCTFPSGFDLHAHLEMLAQPAYLNQLQFFFGKEFGPDNLASRVTRTIYSFGLPLDGFDTFGDDDMENMMNQYYVLRDRANTVVLDAYEEFTKDETEIEVLSLGWLLDTLIERDVNMDLYILLPLSVVCVLVVLVVLTQSLCLGLTGIAMILLSFPGAYFFFRVVLGYSVFTQFQFMGLFVVLAIGADDIFVASDAFKQSLVQNPECRDDIRVHLGVTFRRSAKAMLVTSLTTGVAFLATGFSTIPAIKALGLFTSFCVFLNYFMIISYFMGVLAWWRLKGYRWFGCCGRSIGIGSTKVDVEKGGKENAVSKFRWVERFFHSKWAPWVQRWMLWILLIWLAVFVVFVVYAAKIQPPQKTINGGEFFDADYFLNRAIDTWDNGFPQVESVSKPYIAVVWGVGGIDRTGIDPNDQMFVGTTLYDKAFDPSAMVAQQAIYDLCQDMLDASKYGTWISGTAGHREVQCAMRDFALWVENVQNDTFPVAAASFHSTFRTWWEDSVHGGSQDSLLFPERNYHSMVGWNEEEHVKYFWVKVNTTLAESPLFKDAQDAYTFWEDNLNEWSETAPEAVSNVFATSFQFFGLFIAETLVSNAIQGTIVGVGLAFVVLVASTRNFQVSGIAILMIISICTIMLGIITMFEWSMGLIESVAIVVLVGMSVDYVVHIAEAFIESEGDVFARVQTALMQLGISVLGGAISTTLSTVPVLNATLLLLRNFCILICLSATVSFLHATVVFPAALLLLSKLKEKKVAKK